MKRATADCVVVLRGARCVGCGPRPEEPLLGEFFNASRLRDRTALQKIATTIFDPARDGIVTGFEHHGRRGAAQAGGRATEGRVDRGAGEADGRADGRKAAGGDARAGCDRHALWRQGPLDRDRLQGRRRRLLSLGLGHDPFADPASARATVASRASIGRLALRARRRHFDRQDRLAPRCPSPA